MYICGATSELSDRRGRAMIATVAVRNRHRAGLVVGILRATVVGLCGFPKVGLGQTLKIHREFIGYWYQCRFERAYVCSAGSANLS